MSISITVNHAFFTVKHPSCVSWYIDFRYSVTFVYLTLDLVILLGK